MDSFYRHQSVDRSKCLVVGVTLILLKVLKFFKYNVILNLKLKTYFSYR